VSFENPTYMQVSTSRSWHLPVHILSQSARWIAPTTNGLTKSTMSALAGLNVLSRVVSWLGLLARNTAGDFAYDACFLAWSQRQVYTG